MRHARPQATRADAARLRQELVDAAASTVSELRRQLSAEARAIAGLPICENVPQALTAYLKVLEHAVEDGEARCLALRRDAAAAADAERRARQAAAGAHEAAGAAERALQQQTRRLHALEGMRLQDVQVRGAGDACRGAAWRACGQRMQAPPPHATHCAPRPAWRPCMQEIQGAERRLALAQQELGSLRQGGGGGAACDAPRPPPAQLCAPQQHQQQQQQRPLEPAAGASGERASSQATAVEAPPGPSTDGPHASSEPPGSPEEARQGGAPAGAACAHEGAAARPPFGVDMPPLALSCEAADWRGPWDSGRWRV